MDKINALLADAQALEVKAEQDRTAAFAAQCEAARAAVTAAFDGVWEDIAPYAGGGHYWLNDRKTEITFWWLDIAIPGYAPFIAVWGNSHLGQNAGLSLRTGKHPQDGFGSTSFKDLPEFLLGRKRAGEKAEAERIEKEIAKARDVLDDYWSPRQADSPVAADDALAKLNALAPQRADEWQKLRAAWQEVYEDAEEKRATEREQQIRQAALAAGYESAYAAYYADLQRVLAANATRLDEFQKELDDPFQAWELHYAVVGTDEDGNHVADTRSVNALSGEPDVEGYWVTAGKNWVERTKFFSLFSLSGPVERRPTDEDLCGEIVIGAPGDHYWRRIYCHPLADREQVRTRALMALEPWPAAPEVPEDLDGNAAGDVRRKIVSGATGDYDIDVPF